MSLREQIEEKAVQAQKEKNELSLGLYRLLKSAVKNAQIEKGGELTDEDVLTVLERQAKQRKDSITQFESAGRIELAEHEKAELALIEEFLPEKLSDDEVRMVVKEKLAANPQADFGRVMGAVMAELKGKADGTTVQRIVREEQGQ